MTKKNLFLDLKSRLLVEKALKQSGIPYTVLRASIIIGVGSATFEIIRDLCKKLPIMPKWVNSLCQPIAVGDVLFYLSSVLLNQKCMNKIFDIGGPEALTFKEVMLRYAKFRNLKRWIVSVPVLTPRLSSYWLVFITSVRYSLCSYLVESMKTSTVVQLDHEWFLVQTATFRLKGILGRLYWYALVPFHFFIFQKMAKALAGEQVK